MKKCLIALAFAALISPALAADVVPVKAAPAIGYPFISNGFYAGLGAVGDVAGTNVFGSTVYQAGAAIDLTAGYQWAWAGGANWSALEASFSIRTSALRRRASVYSVALRARLNPSTEPSSALCLASRSISSPGCCPIWEQFSRPFLLCPQVSSRPRPIPIFGLALLSDR